MMMLISVLLCAAAVMALAAAVSYYYKDDTGGEIPRLGMEELSTTTVSRTASVAVGNTDVGPECPSSSSSPSWKLLRNCLMFLGLPPIIRPVSYRSARYRQAGSPTGYEACAKRLESKIAHR